MIPEIHETPGRNARGLFALCQYQPRISAAFVLSEVTA